MPAGVAKNTDEDIAARLANLKSTELESKGERESKAKEEHKKEASGRPEWPDWNSGFCRIKEFYIFVTT